jgi:hypothetical protein
MDGKQDMSDDNKTPLSPTVGKVLDEYFTLLAEDDIVGLDVAKRLDKLLRSGKAPKIEDIDSALNHNSEAEKS